MLRNYLKTALRNLRKNRLYSFINITRLSIGIAGCLLIFIYIQYELSYDEYNKNAAQIYRLTEILHLPKEDNARAVTSPPMAPILKANLPEVLNTVRINFSGRLLSYGEMKLFDAHLVYADSTLFDLFTFPMIEGDPQAALVNPYSIVLTESMVKKYFGRASALGKTMKLSDTINVAVTGVVKDVPANTHITFDGIREVLGASVGSITELLIQDFIKLVIVSIFIATPVAYLAIHRWLDSFAYRVDISWGIFLVVGLVAVVISFATVSVESIKAATANPVKRLRRE